MGKYSIVEYISEHSGYKCGYCKGEDTNYSIGMWAHSLTVEDYQDLIDRGWRRSGKYVYKPTMDRTCCPQYTIRCRATDFRPTKSQKKVIKRNNRYFNTGDRPDGPVGGHDDRADAGMEGHACDKVPDVPLDSSETSEHSRSAASSDKHRCDSADKPSKPPPKPGLGANPSKPLCKKAKLLRLQKRQQKLQQQPTGGSTEQTAVKDSTNPPQVEAKSLRTLLSEIRPDAKHKLEVRLVRSSPQSPMFKQTFEESFQVYKKYQMVIHKDPPDKPTEKQFTRFLVDSPLEPLHHEGGFPDGFGSFHQQYLIDGKIVAVGVVDILPHSLSSVYLYYDPDWSFLSLGTYSALREADFVKKLHSQEASIEYYYMGFYIYSCPKMIYKGKYAPSFLLCPESYAWVPIEKCNPKLDANKYSRFDETGAGDVGGRVVLSEVMCLYQRQIVPYVFYRAFSLTDDSAEVMQYAALVGMTCAKRMLLYRTGPPAGNTNNSSDD